MKIRIKFAKYGVMKFIGHLDIMRYFQKAIRRAGIDVTYSTGFSPHQVMSFAAPLGVGLESMGEYMDLEINSAKGGAKKIIDDLNAVMVDGMEILAVKRLPDNASNAMASVAAAKYKIHFKETKETPFPLEKNVSSFFEQEEILVTKKTKKSEIELNLRSFIFDMYMENDDIIMVVDASSSGNIKPKMVVRALFETNGKEFHEFDCSVTRLDTYMNLGTLEEPKFEPLDAIGEDFA